MQKVRAKLAKGIYWGAMLDYGMQSYISICFAAFITLAGPGLEMSSPGLAISNLSLVIFLLILIVLPLWTLWFLLTRFSKLREEENEEKYGIMYEGLRHDEKAMMNTLWFILRRLIMVLAFVFMREQPTLTLMTIFCTQGVTIVYMMTVHPYEDKAQQKTEMKHEFTFLITLYHVLCFSPAMIDPTGEAKYAIGFSFIGCLGLNISYEIGRAGTFAVKKAIAAIKRRFAKKVKTEPVV